MNRQSLLFSMSAVAFLSIYNKINFLALNTRGHTSYIMRNFGPTLNCRESRWDCHSFSFWPRLLRSTERRLNGQTEWNVLLTGWKTDSKLLSQSTRSPSHTSVCFKSWSRDLLDIWCSVTRHGCCSGGSDTLTAEGPADQRRSRKAADC